MASSTPRLTRLAREIWRDSATPAIAGNAAGEAVKAARLTAESAGDIWVRYANLSYSAGRSFELAFDATGAVR